MASSTPPLEGCYCLAFMLPDQDVAAVSPSSVCRVLKVAGRIGRRPNAMSSKGMGFSLSHPRHWTRIRSDKGSRFIARDFKTFVREVGLEHVRTSAEYPADPPLARRRPPDGGSPRPPLQWGSGSAPLALIRPE